MAGPAPNSKLWTARENRHKDAGLYLLVGGQVEVSDANKQPVLTEGQTRDPQTLALDLAIADSAESPVGAAVWKVAKLHKDVEADQYRRVEVRWEGAAVADFPVIDDQERVALMDKQADAQNTSAAVKARIKKLVSGAKQKATAPKTTGEKIEKIVKVAKKAAPEKAAPKEAAPKKAAAKKAAPKKAAPKKAVSKKAAKKAKAAPKKVARKSTKKSARKSASKVSPLKKLVKKLVKKLTPARKKSKNKR